jgi:hypothetical protein
MELTFWILLLLSSAMSAAIILADDGWRALHVTHAFIVCFVAAGFSAPTVVCPRMAASPLRWRYGALAIGAVAVLFVVGPGVSRALLAVHVSEYAPMGEKRADGIMVVPGGRFITGFQVIPDGVARPLNVPTLFVSEFRALVRMTSIEHDFGAFADFAVERAPFAIVVTGRYDDRDQSNIFIAPITLLEQGNVAAWRLQVLQAPPGGAAWTTLRFVVKAEPIP